MISLCPKTAPDAHQLKNARQHDAFRRLREISVRVLVLAVVERLAGLRLRRPVKQEAEVGSDERVWCRDRVGVVHGSVLPRERDVAGILAQAVLELGADLAGPELEPARRSARARSRSGSHLACSCEAAALRTRRRGSCTRGKLRSQSPGRT